MRRVAEFKRDYASTLKNLMPEDEKAAFIENDVVNVMSNLDQVIHHLIIHPLSTDIALQNNFISQNTFSGWSPCIDRECWQSMGPKESHFRTDVPFVLFDPHCCYERKKHSSTRCRCDNGL